MRLVRRPRPADAGQGGRRGHGDPELATKRATVVGEGLDADALAAAVAGAGYELVPAVASSEVDPADAADAEERTERAAARGWLLRCALAWPLGLVVMWLAFWGPDGTPWRVAQLALTAPIQFVAKVPFLRAALARARHRTASMDTLVFLGTLTALFYSTVELFLGGELYFETAALLIAFLATGRYFEARVKRQASRALRALLELGAKEATLLTAHLHDQPAVVHHTEPATPPTSPRQPDHTPRRSEAKPH